MISLWDAVAPFLQATTEALTLPEEEVNQDLIWEELEGQGRPEVAQQPPSSPANPAEGAGPSNPNQHPVAAQPNRESLSISSHFEHHFGVIERAHCDKKKECLISIPRLNDEFRKAESLFPGITSRIPPEKAIDLIMSDLIPSPEARQGIEPGASAKEIRCYKNWLARVERGSNCDDLAGYSGPIRPLDIDIRDQILPFYRKSIEN